MGSTHTETHLMLQAAVLALRVFPDCYDVDVSVVRSHSWQGLAVHHTGVQIQSGTAARKMSTNRELKFCDFTSAKNPS